MNLNDLLNAHLGHLDHLLETVQIDDKNTYVQPRRRHLGVVSLVLLREITGPTVFRGEDVTNTTIDVPGLYDAERLRATPNKFKFVERGQGLQILRAYGVGGRFAQNRTAVLNGNLTAAFDLNTAVFGDSAMDGSRVLPVKAGVSYSDGLSVQPAYLSTSQVMHHQGGEEGTLYDPTTGKNSTNLFQRHFIVPGTFFVQVLTFRGKTLPKEAFEHLLLCIGAANSYGGQTSVNGTNVRTHVVGAYGGAFETPEGSPYVLLNRLLPTIDPANTSVDELRAKLHAILAESYPDTVDGTEVEARRDALAQALIDDTPELRATYEKTGAVYSDFFARYFKGPEKVGKGSKKGAKDSAPESSDAS